MEPTEREMRAHARAQKEANWITNEDLSARDPVVLNELLRIKFMQFYMTGGMDALDTLEERMAREQK